MLAVERLYARVDSKSIWHIANSLQLFVSGAERRCHYTTKR